MVGACKGQNDTSIPITTPPHSTATAVLVATVVIPKPSTSPQISDSPTPGLKSSSELSKCFDDMKILATFGSVPVDQSNTFVAWPGEDYFLGWRIRNTGACFWDSAYSLEAVNSIQNQRLAATTPVVLKNRVAPGNSIEVQFNVSAPLSPGDYPVSWVLLNGYREPVGQELRATIHVPGDSNDKPLPTITPNPNVQFEASSTQVAPYEKLVLSWEVKQAKVVYFYSTGHAWMSNQVPLKGVRVFYPTMSADYNLRVVNENNTVESYKIEVEIEPPLGLPDIFSFEIAPKGNVPLGICVDISWAVRGGLTTRVSLSVNENPLVADADRVGDYSDCPTSTGLKIYTLIANGPAGSVSESKIIHVVP